MNFIHTYIDKIVVHFSKVDIMTDEQEDNQHFGSLQITFNDNAYLIFEDNGDAETIGAIIQPIFSIDDKRPDIEYPKEIVLDNKPYWSEFINTKLINFKLLQSIGNQIAGCKLYFDNKKTLTYYNYYDDAKVAFDKDDLLNSFVEYENLNWVEVERIY